MNRSNFSASVLILFTVSAALLSAQTNTFPSSGNVGIGTTTPDALLTLQSPGEAGLHINSVSSTPVLRLERGGVRKWGLLGEYPASGSLSLYSYDLNNHVMVFNSSGNVGIGSATPSTRLEVKGPSTSQGTVRVNSAAGQYSSYGWLIGDVLQWGAYAHPGTTPAGGLIFANAANVDMVMFSQNGNVGFGTTYPGYKLDARDATDAQIAAVESGSGNYNRIIIGANANEAYVQELYSNNAKPMTFKINTEVMRIAVSGNVGIGTASPGAKLEVNGGIIISSNGAPLQFLNSLSGVTHTLATDSSGSFTVTSAGAVVYQNLYASGNRYNYFATNVGIGTTNPGANKLAVNGTIRAKEVIVDTGWSDYVFRPDYHLASLSEVEGAIQKDGHLPGIPSASEVAEHGISVGEMQAKLLAKIEELTLHVIAQEKRAESQSLKISALEAELVRLSGHSSP